MTQLVFDLHRYHRWYNDSFIYQQYHQSNQQSQTMESVQNNIKTTINTGVARAARDASELVKPYAYLSLLGIQTILHPKKLRIHATFARKSIANWSLRKSMPIGLRCQMRLTPGDILYFIDAASREANTASGTRFQKVANSLKYRLFNGYLMTANNAKLACLKISNTQTSNALKLSNIQTTHSIGINDIYTFNFLQFYDFLRFSRGFNFKSAFAQRFTTSDGSTSTSVKTSNERDSSIAQASIAQTSVTQASSPETRNTKSSVSKQATESNVPRFASNFGFNVSFSAAV